MSRCKWLNYLRRFNKLVDALQTLPRPLSPTRKDVKLNKYSSQLTQDKVCGVTWAWLLAISFDLNVTRLGVVHRLCVRPHS